MQTKLAHCRALIDSAHWSQSATGSQRSLGFPCRTATVARSTGIKQNSFYLSSHAPGRAEGDLRVMAKNGKSKKGRLRVCRVIHVPLREVSGICLRREQK